MVLFHNLRVSRDQTGNSKPNFLIFLLRQFPFPPFLLAKFKFRYFSEIRFLIRRRKQEVSSFHERKKEKSMCVSPSSSLMSRLGFPTTAKERKRRRKKKEGLNPDIASVPPPVSPPSLFSSTSTVRHTEREGRKEGLLSIRRRDP